MAAMGGLNVIVFTGGVGENAAEVRRRAVTDLECFGILLDSDKNKNHSGGIEIISKDDSPVSILVVPTNEELVIARETLAILGGKKKQKK